MEILAICSVALITAFILSLLIGCVHIASLWTDRAWIVYLAIFVTHFIAYFVIDFTLTYAQHIWSQKG